jgi:serine/threonine-protein kinase
MDHRDTAHLRVNSQEEPEQTHHLPEGGASLFVRLWTFGEQGKDPDTLLLDKDPEVSELLCNLVRDGRGQVVRHAAEGLTAFFDNPLYALSAAKSLQHRLLTFHREQPPQQIVSSILVSGQKNATAAVPEHPGASAQEMLDSNYSAQILVSEPIYELAKNQPGFQFNPKPVFEAGAGGAGETVYELLWTDESTYGHLRDAGQSTGIHTSGRYQIQEELGQGAMGVVYKAYDQLIGRTVALKTISINRNAPNRKELIERLKQEAKAAGGLDHPNIITIYDVGQEDDLVYLSMQFLEGKTLLAMLDEGNLPSLPTLISYADQICSAVGFAHARSVIHRDLKPANLMLTSQGVIKVLDFGIAKLEDATLTQTGLVVGTPTHMSPEQISDRKIDHRSDIFALGSVFYELFTREKPFKGDITTVLYKIMNEDPLPPSVINPGLPGGIDAIIRKALAKDPKDRFQTCEEMCKAFREQAALLHPAAMSAGTPAAKTVMPAPNRPVPAVSQSLEVTTPRRPKRAWRWLVTLLLLTMIGASAWTFYVKSRTGQFPRLVQRLAAALYRKAAQQPEGSSSKNATPSAQPAAGPSNQGAQNSSGIDSANTKPAEPNAGAPAATNGEAPAAPIPIPSPVPVATSQSSTTLLQNEKTQSVPGNDHAPEPATAGRLAPTPSALASPTPTNPVAVPTAASSSTVGIPATSPQSAGTQSQTSSGNTQTEPATESAENPVVKKPAQRHEAPRTVEGFSRRDVPDLLRQASAAAGRGDYGLARYEYKLILKLDPGNTEARTGLRQAQVAEQGGPRR